MPKPQESETSERIEGVAPDDVVHTITWLREQGWLPTDVRYSPDHFGDTLTEWSKGENRMTIIRDRGQWILDIRMAGWNGSYDLGIITDAMSRREEWLLTSDHASQLPDGVVWAEVVPRVLAWLTDTNNVEARLETAIGGRNSARARANATLNESWSKVRERQAATDSMELPELREATVRALNHRGDHPEKCTAHGAPYRARLDA